ncbi:MAG: hypothetical protein JWO74_2154 [Solirubrobacterales bacterium]|jgi:hypothetical protein|nr:hypothetical protein [Solirubrobacterales bacterium]
MPRDDRDWLLRHLADQARYLASLTVWARDNPADRDVLLRVRDDIFTLRETLDTLGVPHAKIGNEDWDRIAQAMHREGWPSAGDASH